MKVMLAGEGADELFGGYYSYLRYGAYARLSRTPVSMLGRALRRAPVRDADRDYLGSLRDLRFRGSAHVLHHYDQELLFTKTSGISIAGWQEGAFGMSADNGDAIRSAMLFDQRVRLPNDLLPRTDRATMAYSLEARVPYLDRQVVELANALGDRLAVRLFPPQGKWLLKRLAARHVGRGVVYRRKRGFNLPVEHWLTVDFRERINGFFRDRAIDSLNYDYLSEVYDAHVGGRHRAALLWAWMVLEQWYRLWIDGGATPRRPAVVSDPASYELLACAGEAPAR
jgi:asparagine synthase (glutamine-hydrolysing)